MYMDHISNLVNLSNNYALLIRCFVHIHTSEVNDVTNGAKEDDEERKKDALVIGDFLVWYFRDAFSHHWEACWS